MSVTVKPVLAEVKITRGATPYIFGNNLESCDLSLAADARSSSAEVIIGNEAGTWTNLFLPGDAIEVRIGKANPPTTLVFSGVLERIKEVRRKKNLKFLHISATDHSWILTSRLINTAYHTANDSDLGTKIDDIVKDLLTKDSTLLAGQSGYSDANIATGITVTNVQSFDQRVRHIVFPKMPIMDCLKQLADISRANFYVDVGKDMHFFRDETIYSNVTLDTNSIIEIGLEDDGLGIKNGVAVEGADVNKIDKSQETDASSVLMDANYLADEFTPNSIEINGVAVKVRKVGNPANDLKGEIKEGAGAAPTTPQSGPTVVLFSISKDKVGTTADWVFMDAKADLDVKKTYWLILYKTGDASNTYAWHHDNATNKTNAFSSDGTTWTVRNGTSFDLNWRVYAVDHIIALHYDFDSINKYKLREMAIRDPSLTERRTADALAEGLTATLSKKKRILKVKAFPSDTIINPGELVKVTDSNLAIDDYFSIVEASYHIEGLECLSIDYELVKYV